MVCTGNAILVWDTKVINADLIFVLLVAHLKRTYVR